MILIFNCFLFVFVTVQIDIYAFFPGLERNCDCSFIVNGNYLNLCFLVILVVVFYILTILSYDSIRKSTPSTSEVKTSHHQMHGLCEMEENTDKRKSLKKITFREVYTITITK